MTCDDCIRYPACVFHLTGHENEKCPNFLNKANLVEVVRCKDCRWWQPMDNGFSWNDEGRTDGECQMLYSTHYAERALTEREHFCGYGKRKEQK
jgi:hypothetical protein